MLESRKVLKVVSSLVIGLSLVGIGSNAAQATSFTAPKLGVAEDVPTNQSMKTYQLTNQLRRVTRSSSLLKTPRTKGLLFTLRMLRRPRRQLKWVQLSQQRLLRRLTTRRLLELTRSNG